MINAFNVIVMRAFFLDLPEELIESARIDGAGELRILFRIVLPLSKAVLAVVGLFYAVGYWNAFFSALLYLNTPEKWPLQLVLRTYVVNQTPMGSDQLARRRRGPATAAVASRWRSSCCRSCPSCIVYPFLQRHFAKGVLVGAVKG